MTADIDATAFKYRVVATDATGSVRGVVYYTDDVREAKAVAANHTSANGPDGSARVEANPEYKGHDRMSRARRTGKGATA